MRAIQFLCLVALCALALTPATAAVIFQDGFNGEGQGSFQTVNSGATLGPWTVGGNSIDWIHNYWQPQEGDGSVDLAGNGPGSVSTPLATLAGGQYILTFYLAGNVDGGDAVKTVGVTVGNLNTTVDFDVTGHSGQSMGWQLVTLAFTATGGDKLTFTSMESGAFGPALDNVTVSTAAQVPEPGSYVLMAAGLGALAMLRRRR